MIRKLLPGLLLMSLLLSACKSQEEGIDLKDIADQLTLLDEQVMKEISLSPEDELGRVRLVPRTINADGSLHVVAGGDWTSGFFPGSLWYMYELSGDEVWKDKATAYTWLLEEQQYNASNHDVGFRMYCSFGNALRLTGDPEIRPVLIQSAETLISRYYPSVGCIRSWDFNTEQWQCPVIIDNMMNLELLFRATQESGDSSYHEIAVQHALTTMKHQFREDYSTVHVVDYDTISGEVRQKNTHQGYSDESSWARGQAWGLYGYTLCYRFTGDERFLSQAEHIADFLLGHPRLPEDGIPYWDFDDPAIPDVPRDVSAGMIMASALYELAGFSAMAETYRTAADHMLGSAWKLYRSAPGENYGFILDHSVGNKPGDSEVDVPLNYADYYFLEALVRSSQFSVLSSQL